MVSLNRKPLSAEPQPAHREGPEVHRPLRVLFVHDHIGYSGGATHGVTTYFLSVLPRFDPNKVESLLCIHRDRHPAADVLESAGIRPIFLSRSKWNPLVLWDLVRLIRDKRIEVLHVTGMKAMLLGRIASRLTGRPVIVHFHDTNAAWPRFLQRRLARWTAWALAVCEPVRRVAIQDYGLPPGKVEVLHNGIATDQFQHLDKNARHQIRVELTLADHVPVIGVFGRLFAAKGQHVMLRAVPNVLARCPEAKLLIVGDGPDRSEYERLCSMLGVLESVRFTGHRKDIPALMSAVDVVVVPSICEEATPYVVLEALCAGRPVVASRVGGITEIISDGKTGVLVPKEDVTALADAVVGLLTDRGLRERLAEGGRQHAQYFTTERHVRRLTAIYRMVYTANDMRLRPRRSAST